MIFVALYSANCGGAVCQRSGASSVTGSSCITPYTPADELSTIFFTRCQRHASSAFWTPRTFTSRLIHGFSAMVEGMMPATENTPSACASGSISSFRRSTSPRTKRQRGSASSGCSGSSEPSDRLSNSTTSRASAASRCSAMCEPTWLAPPRTTNFPSEMAGNPRLRLYSWKATSRVRRIVGSSIRASSTTPSSSSERLIGRVTKIVGSPYAT